MYTVIFAQSVYGELSLKLFWKVGDQIGGVVGCCFTTFCPALII